MKISNPRLENFKIKNHPNQIEETQLGEKNVFSSCFMFKTFAFFSSTTKTVLLQDFKIWVCVIFLGKLKMVLEWILYRPSFLRLQHGNWYDEFGIGKWSAGVVVGGRSKQKSSILSSVKKRKQIIVHIHLALLT